MHSIPKYTLDAIRQINKKSGILLEKSDINEKVLGSIDTTIPHQIDLDNIAAFNQNKERFLFWSCTAQAVAMAVMQHYITERRDKGWFIDPAEQWQNQLDFGTAGLKRGDSINSAMKICIEHGLTLRKGDKTEKVRPKGKVIVNKADWKSRLDKGQRIITGSGNLFPMIDLDYFWRPVSPGKRNHCYIADGYDDKIGGFINKNSFGNWGLNNSGRFYTKYEDVDAMFRGRVFEF